MTPIRPSASQGTLIKCKEYVSVCRLQHGKESRTTIPSPNDNPLHHPNTLIRRYTCIVQGTILAMSVTGGRGGFIIRVRGLDLNPLAATLRGTLSGVCVRPQATVHGY